MRRWLPLALAVASLAADAVTLELRPVVSGLSTPLEITHAGDGSGRLFVVEQQGLVKIVRDGAVLPTPFLDVTGIVAAGGEQGLLGLAFHRQYAINGRFYVFYNRSPTSSATGSDLVIARYTRSAANPDVADAASGTPILVIAHPDANNPNGGKLAFGPDGYLYIGVGDGGGGGDPFNAGQNLGDLRGKILRIDVNGAAPYAIPPSNPLVARAGARGEIFAYGLRNPFRFNFDRATGDLFIGDVGQNQWEEIDLVPAGSAGGQNFGWRLFEGAHCFQPPSGCTLAGHAPPIIEYGHDGSGGFSVTGGVRYRGRMVPELRGQYIYGDYVSGRLWTAIPDGAGTWLPSLAGSLPNVSSFGEDESGEVYVTDHGTGRLLRLAVADADGDGMSDAFEAAHFASAVAGDSARDDDGDGLRNIDEYREGRHPLAKDNDVFADARLFAMQQYRDFLAREGDAAGIDFWTGRVGAGQPRANVIGDFLSSPEFQGVIAPVARLYFAFFLRVPDYQGLTYWIARYRGGDSLESIADYFAASPEFAQTYGALDNGAFVDRVYENVLDRAPEAAGRAFWKGELDSGARTRGEVMLGFSESGEYRQAVSSQVYVTLTYTGMLQRGPDPNGFDFWVDYLDRGNSGIALIDGFLASPEYHGRFF